jgi:hypothetical protein
MGKTNMLYTKSSWFCICLSIIAMIVSITTLLFCYKNNFVTNQEKIVGVWLIDAVGAPFQPHIATFHSDKTMAIHNPEAGDPHTSDSMGMGLWKALESKKGQSIAGKFVELNADRNTNKYVNKLVVTYKIIINDNTFTGPAQATYYNPDDSIHSGPFSVTLYGKKLLFEN